MDLAAFAWTSVPDFAYHGIFLIYMKHMRNCIFKPDHTAVVWSGARYATCSYFTYLLKFTIFSYFTGSLLNIHEDVLRDFWIPIAFKYDTEKSKRPTQGYECDSARAFDSEVIPRWL